ncbi:hypothetical protein RJ640_008586 [Escallonia rubra]|uniref:Uncharacterized protein n=1 Tax=Escallonia rubra TaxID=112253 RepID=A0AA88UDF2_9ASTE|nr:hypothetical protein RJ640_008586 [Escallonia rubra]
MTAKCGGILSALSDRLYDVYHATKSAKELWNLLQGEYGIDDAGIERFNASTFNKFVMVEGKAISDQIHEFQDHLRVVEENDSKFSEDYKVSCLIDKLPPSWSDFAKGERLLLIPMVIVLLCVMLRKGFTLNEPEADIFARYSHTYPWRTHLNESGREAATVGTGLIPKDSRENQD